MHKLIYVLKLTNNDGQSTFIQRVHETGRRMLALQPLGLRLNVHDKDAEPGAFQGKSSAYGPFEAAVQVWLDDVSDRARGPHEDLLSDLKEEFHGYLVDERLLVTNLANPPVPGRRNEGYSQLAVLQIPKRLDRETWLDRWQGRHTWVAISIHPHLEYTQNPVLRAVTKGAPPIDGFGEETLPIGGLTDVRVLFKAVDDPKKFKAMHHIMYEDAARFIDFDHIDLLITSQFDLRSPPR